MGAYASGLFPMAEARDDPDVFWVDPRRSGILPLDGFHLSRSLARRLRRGDVRASLDAAFEAVLDGCADRSETWINDTIRDVMLTLFDKGYAHSFEVWQNEELIGGMYGVALGAAFFGESMFSNATDGSKIALAVAVDHLRRTGFTLFDAQFLTEHLASLGAVESSRGDYKILLTDAIEASADIPAIPVEQDLLAVVQRITQTS